MKIVAVYSDTMNNELRKVLQIVYNTLHELDVNIEEINLKGKIGFYDGIKTREALDIISRIRQADACILATEVNLFMPSAYMKAFLEHCTYYEYKGMLSGKHYLTVSFSDTLGETECAQYLQRVIDILGGDECGRIAIGARDYAMMATDVSLKETIEKIVENFYRVMRQNRRIFFSSEADVYQRCIQQKNNYAPIQPQYDNGYQQIMPNYQQPIQSYQQPNQQPDIIQTPEYFPPQMPKSQPYNYGSFSQQEQNKNNYPQPQQTYTQPSLPPEPKEVETANNEFNEIRSLLDNIRNKSQNTNIIKEEPKVQAHEVQFEAFAERQEEDIKDLNRMFSQQDNMQAQPQGGVTYSRPYVKSPEVVYREKTCNQMMQALPHHFQSNLSAGVKAMFQFCISGEENFEGYLNIENGETFFMEGVNDKSDIVIYTSSSIMKDIMRGKYSAQKAFMTGQLKVRGNFALLTKFDQLYKKMP